MKILFIGDIFGKSGRNAVANLLPSLKKDYGIDFVIANAENATHGKGLSRKSYNYLVSAGVELFTMGNHTWFRKEEWGVLNEREMIRPMNLVKGIDIDSVGVGSRVITLQGSTIRVTNLLGGGVNFKERQVNPFTFFEDFLNECEATDFHIVDFHAETTSEKNAFFWKFNGRVSAVLGTHTHIPTADYWVSDEGTAYITDVGLTGPSYGVIGGERESIIKKFMNPVETFTLRSQPGPSQLCSVLLELSPSTKKCVGIKQILIFPECRKLSLN